MELQLLFLLPFNSPFFFFLISSLFLLISFSNLDVSRKIEKTNQEKNIEKTNYIIIKKRHSFWFQFKASEID
jgi:hypothetical protein